MADGLENLTPFERLVWDISQAYGNPSNPEWATHEHEARVTHIAEVLAEKYPALTRPPPSPSDAESNLRSCNICGFTIDLARGHTKPSISFTMAGRRGAGDKAVAGPEIDLSGVVDRVMQETWDDICADTQCHPLDITHEGRKALSFHPGHWAAAIARNLSSELARMRGAASPCPACDGTGGQDEGDPEIGQRLIDCDRCNGTGKRGAAVPGELMAALATLFHGYCRPEDGPQKFSMVVSPDWSWTGRDPLDCVKAWDIVQGVLYPAAAPEVPNATPKQGGG